MNKPERQGQWLRMVCLSIALLLASRVGYAEPVPNWERLADSIKITENGHGIPKGELYGIHTVHYRDEAEARAIAIRTCKHAWRDHKGDYWTFLAKRYCPGNWKVWKANTEYFYQRSIA